MMDREDEVRELPAGSGEEHEEAVKSQGESQEEDMIGEESVDEESDDEETAHGGNDEKKITPKDFWITGLPDPEDAEFRKYTHRTPVEGTHGPLIYEPGDEQCSMWESHPDHECYSSFGDGGTTATVNAFGQLMQFSTYLGRGQSGMFSVDHTCIWVPYYPSDRANKLNDMSRARNRAGMTYGVYFPGLIVEDDLVRKYVHCRWPRYEYESEKAKVVNQWMVHDGVVLQQWRFTNLDTEEISTKIVFSKDMFIRDVQYQTWDRSNLPSGAIDDHHFLGPESYSWIYLHELSKDDSTNIGETRPMDNSLGVIVSVFIDGVAMKFHSNEERNLTVEIKQTKEVVVAYKLVYSTSGVSNDWKQFLVEADKANVDNLLLKEFISTQYRTIPLFSLGDSIPNVSASETMAWDKIKSNLDFIFQRHLEHLLTVCAIPIPSYQGSNNTCAVALTCGDISAHRICTSSSLFAFLFLLQVDSYLRSIESPNETYVSSLRDRIKKVCEGHLIWLNDVELSEGRLFELGYMANGKRISANGRSRHANEWTRNNLTDTAFQIIKAGEFAEHYSKDSGNNEWQLARKVVRRVYGNWITHLDKLDERGKFVWPRYQGEDLRIFRLDDHVWVIKALKLAELMIFSKHTERGVQEHATSAPERRPRLPLEKKYSYANVQKEVVQRFAVHNQNYQSNKRMLAVTRSMQESRFLFHARDTALFYNTNQMEWKGTQFIELLKNTIDSQSHHVDSEESGWDNTLRYALAIIVGTCGYKINAKPSLELAQSSMEVLFGSFSSNGFVAGLLDKDTKKRVLFEYEEDADSYYHASFEIPYILLRYATQIYSLHETQLSEITTSDPSATVKPTTDLGNSQQTKLQQRQSIFDITLVSIPANEQNQPAKVVDAMRARANLTMKKTTPFNDLVDITNIVDRDDEWLYNYPSIFSRNTKIDLKEALASAQLSANYSEISGIVKKEINHFHGNLSDVWKRGNSCFIVDIQQTKHSGRLGERDYGVYPNDDNLEFWQALKKPRTRELAKKRLIWMPLVREFQAPLCYLATPETHQISISLFFDRHVKNESYFFEDTALVENAWETEFHLSFYSLINSDPNHAEGMATSSAEEFPGTGQKKKIALCSMGFRFDGDIFDRYWTGYFLENVPGLYREDRFDYYPGKGHQPLFIESNNKAYRQRKVLELLFFDRMIEQIVRCTQEISYSIREELGMKQSALSSSILSSEDYFTSSVLWNKYQHILHVIEEELESAIGVIGKWEKREDDRKGEEPRWTRNDEMKYRGMINKSKGSTKRRVMDLHVAYRNIKTLRETIVNSQDQIRNDLSLQGSENIRFFTYVTVVFLPLGFATGIFSMSGAPDGKVLGSMAACAVVALFLTVLALLNAKQLAKIVDDLFSVYHRHSQAKMERSFIVYDKKMRRNTSQDVEGAAVEEADDEGADDEGADDEEAGDEGADENHDRAKRKTNSHHKQRKIPSRIETWTLLFWVHYFSIELPARRVLLASNSLKSRKPTFLTLIHVFLEFMVFQLTPSSAAMQDSDDKYKERLNVLIHPPDAARPMKLLVQRLKALRENGKRKKESNTPEERDSDNDSEN
ncbi:uncharacterized protein Bfra_008802 [Botrytis fragariae]|uniref:Uncharacterized protein n=1 Tax=Botrytis fragariae TaxID=1964551 RepID=A0A8H6APW5_9HELO|nr:uncharacterized protein Bfra_008802 [Botrytis fragariae]KAF5871778.1 hypothetical protein Bfra_008802 [Botrytis fragariae]